MSVTCQVISFRPAGCVRPTFSKPSMLIFGAPGLKKLLSVAGNAAIFPGPLLGQKPLGWTAAVENALALTGAYEPYLLPGFLSKSVASATHASEGSVATPDKPKTYCCFSKDKK